MSHIAEVYAKDLGVKIGQPKLTEHFLPGVPENYITIKSEPVSSPGHYQYWSIVSYLIREILTKHNLKLLQIGHPKDAVIEGVDQVILGASIKQFNYILKKSKAHISHMDASCQVASVYDVPSVVLYHNTYSDVKKPLFNKNNKTISLEVDYSKRKPSFSNNTSRINEINPEDIAQSILDQLGIDEKIKFKTVRKGANFSIDAIEIVPNFFSPINGVLGQPVTLRGDAHFDVENITRWSQHCPCSLHIDQPFGLDLLPYMTNLRQLVFLYSKEHENIDLRKFLKTLKNKKVDILIVCKDKEIISDVRLKYFDYLVVEEIAPKEEVKASYYFSRKKFFTNGKMYSSEFAAKRLDNSDKFFYDENSSKELESLYLYE